MPFYYFSMHMLEFSAVLSVQCGHHGDAVSSSPPNSNVNYYLYRKRTRYRASEISSGYPTTCIYIMTPPSVLASFLLATRALWLCCLLFSAIGHEQGGCCRFHQVRVHRPPRQQPPGDADSRAGRDGSQEVVRHVPALRGDASQSSSPGLQKLRVRRLLPCYPRLLFVKSGVHAAGRR